MTAYSAILKDYIGRGLDADKPEPASVNVGPNTSASYYATDTEKLYTLNAAGNAWVWINAGGGGGGSVDSVGVTAPLVNTGDDTDPVIAISDLSKSVSGWFPLSVPNPVSDNSNFMSAINGAFQTLNQLILALSKALGSYKFISDNRAAPDQNYLLLGADAPVDGSQHIMMAIMNIYAPPPTVKHTLAATGGVMRHAARNDTGRIVAVSSDSTCVYSDDEGQTWTEVAMGVSVDVIWVAWDGTHFVACGTSGYVGYSTDGTSWTNQTISSENLYCVGNHAGVLVITGNGTASYLSTDHGVTWTSGGTLPAAEIWHGMDINPSTGQRVITGFNGALASSSDGGATWTAGTGGGSIYWTGVVWSATAGYWTAMSATGEIITSTDGLTWTSRPNFPMVGGTRIEFHNGIWLCAGGTQDTGKMCYTADPIAGSWTVVLTGNKPVQAMLILNT